MLLVEQSLVAGRILNLVEHSMQPMTKPNSNTFCVPLLEDAHLSHRVLPEAVLKESLSIRRIDGNQLFDIILRKPSFPQTLRIGSDCL